MVGDSSPNLVPDLPSWVSNLSSHGRPDSFEQREDYFAAGCGVQPHGLKVDKNVLILYGLHLDRIAISSEAIHDIEDGEGILQILNSPESVDINSKESQDTAIRRF